MIFPRDQSSSENENAEACGHRRGESRVTQTHTDLGLNVYFGLFVVTPSTDFVCQTVLRSLLCKAQYHQYLEY